MLLLPLKHCLSMVGGAGIRDGALAACMRCTLLTLWCTGRGSASTCPDALFYSAQVHAVRALTLPCAHAGG